MTRSTVRFDPITVAGRTMTARWRVDPATDLYRRCSMSITLPEGWRADALPDSVWWRLVLWCLHPHWTLLGSCRVVLPIRLDEHEAEFWLRRCDAAAWTLAARIGRDPGGRSVEIVGSGPRLAAAVPPPRQRLTAACFSGGRDSLAQWGVLQELGEPVLLVTTTSPRPGSVEHTSQRHDEVMAEVGRRTGGGLVTVESDFRDCADNGFGARRYGLAVTEITDCLLYQAAAVAVAWLRGADRVAMAAEYEVHTTEHVRGRLLQHDHFMYSAATLAALSALTEQWGIVVTGLTAPLRQFQVQRLLALRYCELLDLQYSCWELADGQTACSACGECARIAWYLVSDGVRPDVAGIDLRTVLLRGPGWTDPPSADDLRSRVAQESASLKQRRFALADEELVAECVGGDATALTAFRELRAQALADVVEPTAEPGYSAAYLDLVDDRYRAGLTRILDQQFVADRTAADETGRDRILTLARWLTDPLRRAGPPTRPADPDIRPVRSAFRVPAPLGGDEQDRVAAVLPAPEPRLVPASDGSVRRVADTDLTGREREYLLACLDDNHVSSTGRFVTLFEEAFARFAGTAHAVACTSGTTALQLAYAAAGIGPGDDVIMPTFTMIATANAATHLGARPVFVDTDPATWNLSLESVVDALTPATRAIVLVHTYGRPVDPRPFADLAERNGLLLIEDAAEAHGARAHGRPVGSLGDVAGFSLYGNKILTAGEGGVVTTDDATVAAAARELRDHGFSPERHFWHRLRAYNFRMSNLQAAVGLAQVERATDLVAARERLAERYDAALAGIPGIELRPALTPGLDAVTWMYGVRVTEQFPARRDEVRHALASCGVETRTFFVPMHLQPAYLRDHRGSFPVAEGLAREGLYLPSGPSVGAADVARAADCLRQLSATSPRSR